jgi:hypothetical protein
MSNSPQHDLNSSNSSRTSVVAALTLATALFSGGCSFHSSSPEKREETAQSQKVLPEKVLAEVRAAFTPDQFDFEKLLQGGSGREFKISAKNGDIYFDRQGDNLVYSRRVNPDEPSMLPSPLKPGELISNPRYYETQNFYLPDSDAKEFAPSIQRAMVQRREAMFADYKKAIAEIEKDLPGFSIREERAEGGATRIDADIFFIRGGDAHLSLRRTAQGENSAPQFLAVVTLRAENHEGELLDSHRFDPEVSERLYKGALAQLELQSRRNEFYRTFRPEELHDGEISRDPQRDEIVFKKGDFTLRMSFLDEEFGASVNVSVNGCPWSAGHSDRKAQEIYETANFILRSREKLRSAEK